MDKKIFDDIMSNISDYSRVRIWAKGFRGLGINGTDAVIFENSKKTRLEFLSSEVSYIRIRYGYNGYMRKIYLPYESIQWIEEREYDAD